MPSGRRTIKEAGQTLGDVIKKKLGDSWKDPPKTNVKAGETLADMIKKKMAEKSTSKLDQADVDDVLNMLKTKYEPAPVKDQEERAKVQAVLDSAAFKDFVKGLEHAMAALFQTDLRQGEVEALIEFLGDSKLFRPTVSIANLVWRIMDAGKFWEPHVQDIVGSHKATDGHTLYHLYLYLRDLGGEAVEEYLREIGEKINRAVDAWQNVGDATPEADEGAPYGKYLFSPQRKGQVPFEKNTPDEDKAYLNLRQHVMVNAPMDNDVAIQLMGDLEDGNYPNILHEPKQEFVYRGISANRHTLAKILGISMDDIDHVGSMKSSTRVTTKPDAARAGKEGSTSWSTDLESIAGFTMTHNLMPFSVILVARKSDNPDTFLEGPGGFYKVPTLAKYSDEEETIALGPVKLCRVFWQYTLGGRGEFDFGVTNVAAEMDRSEMDMQEGRTLDLLRRLIRESLNEADIADVEDTCYTAGSTHVMKTCKIGGNKYFLKFSNEDLFDGVDPSLQILVEYLAYRIYGLFSGIMIPTPELVYDKAAGKVGLATSPASGKMALKVGTDPKFLAKMMSQGVYVDVFLANWDVIGTGSGNVFVDDVGATRIDPGGSLTFRAQGGRKGKAFGPKVGELNTMLKSGSGAGNVYRHADLKVAAKEFLSVDWSAIQSTIDDVRNDVSEQLLTRGMRKLLKQWNADCDEIKGTLAKRHTEVKAHALQVLGR